MNGTIKLCSENDMSRLRMIWQAVFGDSDEYLDCFFSDWNGENITSVGFSDGDIVSAAHLITLGELVSPEKEPIVCRETYALGTMPEFRSGGCGSRVAAFARDFACRDGVSVICPAEPSLFGYYEKIGYETYFYTRKFSGNAGDEGVELSSVSTDEYYALRENFLSDRPHIRFTRHALDYEKKICECTGGGFFRIRANDEDAVFPIEIWDGCAVIKEMLCTRGDPVSIASRACRAVGAESYSLYLPAESFDDAAPYAMASPTMPKSPLPPWFGFSFD